VIEVDEKELKKSGYRKTCQKCGEEIGGKAFYLIKLDCIYDGKTTSACDTIVLCSDCYDKLKTWLHLPK